MTAVHPTLPLVRWRRSDRVYTRQHALGADGRTACGMAVPKGAEHSQSWTDCERCQRALAKPVGAELGRRLVARRWRGPAVITQTDVERALADFRARGGEIQKLAPTPSVAHWTREQP